MSKSYEGWAVVELFGHQRIAGKICEEQIAGGTFLRIDVPAIAGHAAFTRYYGSAAIYSVAPTDEETATAVAKYERNPPVELWMLPEDIKPSTPAIADAPRAEPDFEDDDRGEDFVP